MGWGGSIPSGTEYKGGSFANLPTQSWKETETSFPY